MNPDTRRGTLVVLLILIGVLFSALCAGVGWQVATGGRLVLPLVFGALSIGGSVAAGALVAGWALRGVRGGVAEQRVQIEQLRGDVRDRVLPGLEGQKVLPPPDPAPLGQAARDEILAAVQREVGQLLSRLSDRAAAEEEQVGGLRVILREQAGVQAREILALRGQLEELRRALPERGQAAGEGVEREAGRLVAAVGDASGQAVKLFTGVSRHLDKTWDKVQEGIAGLAAVSEENRRIREGVDKALVRIMAQEQRGREVGQQMEEILAGLEAAQEVAAQQAQVLSRFMTLSRAEQANLAGSIEQLRKAVDRLSPMTRR